MRADFVGPQIDIPAERHQHGVNVRSERAEDAGDDAGPNGRGPAGRAPSRASALRPRVR